jgi:gas vesicle protein
VGRSRTAAALLVALLGTTAFLSACSDNNHTSSLCSDVDALKSSTQDLKNVDVVQNGTSALQSALDQVKSDASKLADSAKTEFKPQVDALTSALSSLGTAVKHIGSAGTEPVKQAASSVQQAATNLEHDITSKKC